MHLHIVCRDLLKICCQFICAAFSFACGLLIMHASSLMVRQNKIILQLTLMIELFRLTSLKTLMILWKSCTQKKSHYPRVKKTGGTTYACLPCRPLSFPSREPGGPPPRQSIYPSPCPNPCLFPGAPTRPMHRRAHRGAEATGCSSSARPHHAKGRGRKDQRKGAEMAGDIQSWRFCFCFCFCFCISCSVPLQACMHDASALCRHMGWVLISKPKRSLESISLAFYCSSAPVQTAASSRPYLLVHNRLDLCTGEILEIYLLKTLKIYIALAKSHPPPQIYVSATHLSLTNWDILYTDFHMTAHTSSSLEYTSVFPKII
jgi:hypothetical protein